MDPSALIFLALALAWAVYLIPKALQHHDEAVKSRSVERFSRSMRVLARREPVNGRNARLVVTPTRATVRPAVETKPRAARADAPVEAAAVAVRPVTAASARRAARRRRNVLALIVLANAVVIALAATSVIHWAWTAIPATVLVAWLVACRLSVKAERRRRVAGNAPLPQRRPVAPTRSAIEAGDPPAVDDVTGEIPAVAPATAPAPAPATAASEPPAVLTGEIPVITSNEGGWDMVPTVLPTYVAKPAVARRTVTAIDFDSTGVWSSGRSEIDSALAREAEVIAKSEQEAAETPQRRASGA